MKMLVAQDLGAMGLLEFIRRIDVKGEGVLERLTWYLGS